MSLNNTLLLSLLKLLSVKAEYQHPNCYDLIAITNGLFV